MNKKIYVQASIIKRLVALLIDLLILDFFVFINFTKFFPKTLDKIISMDLTTNHIIIISIMTFFMLFYFSYLEGKYNQTIGQYFMKIYVIEKVKGKGNSIINNLFLIPFFPFNILWFFEPIYFFMKGERFLEKISNMKTIQEIKLTE